MHLYFVRHGHSTNNGLPVGDDHRRDPDPALTVTGNEQARHLARHLGARQARAAAGEGQGCLRDACPITHLYCGLMRRALETSALLGAELGLRPTVWPELHELGGLWSTDPATGAPIGLLGHGREHFARTWPDLVLPDELTGPWWSRPKETPEESDARAGKLLERLLVTHGDEHVAILIVSHRGFYNVLLRRLLGLPATRGASPTSFQLYNAGLSRLDLDRRGLQLVYQNDTSFLPAELLTARRPGCREHDRSKRSA